MKNRLSMISGGQAKLIEEISHTGTELFVVMVYLQGVGRF
jgi:hypothetical protein